MTSHKQGFSLIEIMIVVMIIGVLAAVTFGGFRFLQRARESATETKVNVLYTMIEEYYTKITEYPSDPQELITGPTKPQLQRRWGSPIAVEDDLKDAWGQPFVYTLNPKGTRPPFDLYSVGAKGDSQIRPKALH